MLHRELLDQIGADPMLKQSSLLAQVPGGGAPARLSLPITPLAGEFIAGARCPVDYRSLIHDELWRRERSDAPQFDWDSFFAATDTLLDVENILYTAEHEAWPSSAELGKLWMYGVLQALAVQQDATEQLLGCFGLTHHPIGEPALKEIRDLRISVVGHPQNHRNKRIRFQGCTFLSHAESLTRFKVGTYANFKTFVPRTFDVLQLINRQQLAIQMSLCQVWNMIRANHPLNSSGRGK